MGYRHIDTAQMYRNERQVGQAVRQSGLDRSEVFVTSKLSNASHGDVATLEAFERTLDTLDLGYLDLFLIHWPMPRHDDYVDTWQTMAHLYESGRSRVSTAASEPGLIPTSTTQSTRGLRPRPRRHRVRRFPTPPVPKQRAPKMSTYQADETRYDAMDYRPSGRSGLRLPALSLGLWQNFGDENTTDTQRVILRRAFDRGISHFDLANNYGPPYGAAESNFGRIFRQDFASHRDEILVSTKAGWDMWPGPYGQGGGSRKHVLASLDQSLTRMGLDYVDIFYSHRFDQDTPLAETMGALDTAVRSGKALYIGISSYSAKRTRQAAEIARDLGTPLLIHQPSYSMLNRWIEDELLDELEDQGMGCIVFTALAQGLLTNKYLSGIPADSRAAKSHSTLPAEHLDESVLKHVRALNEIAHERGQTLAQMALQWALRDSRVTAAVIGASSVEQLDMNIDSLSGPTLTQDQLAAIDRDAVEAGVNLWAKQTSD